MNNTYSVKSKVRCWGYRMCNQGANHDGSCPVVEQISGTVCWVVDGTLCRELTPENYLDNIDTCRQCDYYMQRKKGKL